MKTVLSIVQSSPQLLSEGDCEKDENTNPNTVARGSIKKYWWVCSKGHHWEATIYNRAMRGYGCPHCSKVSQ